MILDFAIRSELDRCDITEDEAAALVTVLYDAEQRAIPAILPRLLGFERNHAFKLKAIERTYRRIETGPQSTWFRHSWPRRCGRRR
jgi:hypothetical protein